MKLVRVFLFFLILGQSLFCSENKDKYHYNYKKFLNDAAVFLAGIGAAQLIFYAKNRRFEKERDEFLEMCKGLKGELGELQERQFQELIERVEKFEWLESWLTRFLILNTSQAIEITTLKRRLNLATEKIKVFQKNNEDPQNKESHEKIESLYKDEYEK